MVLEKLLVNNIKHHLIGVNITEYDLKKAHPTALALLYPNDPVMTGLANLPKEEYTYKIGNMIKNRPYLRKEIDKKILELFNEFLEANDILAENFLRSTPDSLLIVDQIAQKTCFRNIARFRSKEGISFSSMFVYSSYEYILFDRLTKRLIIKGVKGDENEFKKIPFVRTILKHLCTILDQSTTLEHIELLKQLKRVRTEYVQNKDINVFRSLKDKNMFKYLVGGKFEFSQVPLREDDDCYLVKSDNYINFLFPLMRSFI